MRTVNTIRKILATVFCVLIVGWLTIFATDFIRCNSLKAPIFVVAGLTADDGGSGVYYGLGYKVEMRKYIDEEGVLKLSSVEMAVLGKVISASIE